MVWLLETATRFSFSKASGPPLLLPQQVSRALRSAEHRPGPWSGVPLSSWASVGQGLHHPELQPPLPLGEPAPCPQRPALCPLTRTSREPPGRAVRSRRLAFHAELGCALRRSVSACVLARSISGSQRRESWEQKSDFGDQMSRESLAPSLISSPPGPAPSERGAQRSPATPRTDPCSAGPLTPGGPGLTGITDLGLIHNLRVPSLEETAPQSFQENLAPGHLSPCHLEKNNPKLKSL